MKCKSTHKIVMIAYEGVNLIDVSGPMQAFEEASRTLIAAGGSGYDLRIASVNGGLVVTGPGLAIMTERLADIAGESIHTLIVPGGRRSQPEISAWILRQAAGIPRVCSVCTGAFILAEAQLLNGRKATTHWRWAELLSEQYPLVNVISDSIFINDGAIWTSAGVTAGIDLALALIQEDCGHKIAIGVAREMVVYMKRSGGQAQYSAPLKAQNGGNGVFSDLLAWIAAHLKEDLRVERLAEIAGMSPRNFARSYSDTMGATPGKTVMHMRLEAARGSLEETDLPLKIVARDVGLGDEQNLRRLFQRQYGINPLQYRQRFQGSEL